MAFCLLADELVEEGIKRIASEEIHQAIEEIDSPSLKRTQAIHEVRKHCKKIRAVLRLVRPQFKGTYRFENIWFRDTAKGLAKLRDAEAIIETYDGLLDKFSDQIDRRALAPVRRGLSLRKKKIFEDTGDLNDKLKKPHARMDKASRRVADWELKLTEFDGIETGLVATYREARTTMAAAYDDPIAENFHQWRKQAKYHNYHMRLMHDLWEPVLDSLSKETDDLSDLLGDDHNLDVLHKSLLQSPKKYGKNGISRCCLV